MENKMDIGLSTSDALQDDFVLKMFDYKKEGFFLDVGCCGGRVGSNSYRLELNGWNGICIDINEHPEMDIRKAKIIINNALDIDYKNLFVDNNVPKDIDYASLDIDSGTTGVLQLLPLDDYNIKVITIEHDRYLNGDVFMNVQRQILSDKGYMLLCSDVKADILLRLENRHCSFEDWWVKPEFFDENILNKIKSNDLFGFEIIDKF
jgi:hypothetical protein